jgi:hypothetical protein
LPGQGSWNRTVGTGEPGEDSRRGENGGGTGPLILLFPEENNDKVWKKFIFAKISILAKC